ncbi:MAG: hypothetical protein HQM10_12260 [Candidatus Riflebacteria bacterium]|nr:hypothetical protein [Candidatus Riflebacteria bacterium]
MAKAKNEIIAPLQERIFYSREEIAADLGISANTFDRHIRPFINPIAIGDIWRWDIEDVRRWLRHRKMSVPE